MSEDENKIKAKNKRGFFRNVLKSIKDFDKYEDFGLEGFGRTALYLIEIIAILVVILAGTSTYRFSKTMNDVKNYYEENIKVLSYNDGILDVNDGEKIEINNSENIITSIIIDTSDLSEEKIEEYKEKIKSCNNGIVVLKDKVLLKNQMLSAVTETTYTDLFSKYSIESLSKEQVLDYYNQSKSTIYSSVFATVFISMFAVYLTSAIVDALVITILGYLVARIMGMNIRFGAMFSMGVHALTLSIILNMVYIIFNGITGYTVKYFQFMYNAVAYIYIITAVLIIRSDYIKKQGEIQKIKTEQEKVREELEMKEREREDAENDRKNKEERKKQQDKENNHGNDQESKPQGSNA